MANPKASAERTHPMIRCSGLTKSYRMGDSVVQVLKGLDMSVRPGEFLAIEGRSGSGKSTLLHLLGALDAPDQGMIEYEGNNVTGMSASARSHLRKRHQVDRLRQPGLGSTATWLNQPDRFPNSTNGLVVSRVISAVG